MKSTLLIQNTDKPKIEKKITPWIKIIFSNKKNIHKEIMKIKYKIKDKINLIISPFISKIDKANSEHQSNIISIEIK